MTSDPTRADTYLKNALNEFKNPTGPDQETIQTYLRLAHDVVYSQSAVTPPVEDFRTNYIEALHALLDQNLGEAQQKLQEMQQTLEFLVETPAIQSQQGPHL